MRFKKGDALICKSTYIDGWGCSDMLTEGKTYECLGTDEGFVLVMQDNNTQGAYRPERFERATS
jgi:hypothetical protein